MTLTSLIVQIQRWLIQPHVWRFVGFASTVVGLLCYGLSSSFIHLVGHWNLWKLCLYSVLSFIFCVVVFFAKVWQNSNNSIRFKAHMAFLVLAITSVYSFFYDKAVNKKPDAYSLISCAAFAVMSLSLSLQIHCGFEVDLLYFFLGALLVQLMKIKLLFGIIGACFSYSLIVLRSLLNTTIESGYLEIQDQHHVSVQVDSYSQEANTDTDIAIIKSQLMACIEAFVANNQKLIDMLSKHVKDYIEAYDDDPNNLAPIDNNFVVDALQPKIIHDLREVVKIMVAAGFEKECFEVYSSCRREFLHEFVFGLNLLPRDIEEIVTMDTLTLEFDIKIWIRCLNIATRILFPNERRLCEHVFLGVTSATNLVFMDVCSELLTLLLKFADSFSVGSSSRNLLPGIGEVFGTLLDLIPEFESLFFESPNSLLGNEAINTCKRLDKVIRGIFIELENWIYHDRAMADFPGGLYPISQNVMNYLGGVSEDRISLEKVFQENPFVADREGTFSSVSMQMTKILELLYHHLDFKSKNYMDPALHYLFMINNGRYIEQKIKEYRLETVLDHDWIHKHTAKVQKNLEGYQRSSWRKILALLKLDGNESMTAESMTENLKLFNIQFKEICRVQSTWFVLDKELREEIRMPLEKILWPAYGNIIERLQNILGSQAYEYIEYSMYDIDALLNDLFRGRH